MGKQALKKKISKKQNNRCAISNRDLPESVQLYDTHRVKPKKNGGIYTVANTKTVIPTEHMKEHGTLRLRTKELADLKNLIDAREQFIKARNKIDNQLRAYKRYTDELDEDTLKILESYLKENNILLKNITKRVERSVKALAKDDPLVAAALKVKAIGPITVAYCVSYIDFEKARHASSLWKYVGLHAASHERYVKGNAGGGNKRLRCVLYTMAESQMKLDGPYRQVYDQVKIRLERSEKVTKSRNTQGKLIECMWKDTKPCHRHGAALRAVMKHFLADWWYAGRELSGLPTEPLYPEAVLGGNHRTIMPKERDWKY